MAWADLSDVQVRMRERIKELRCILRAERGRRVRDRHGLSSPYKSGGGQFDRRKTIRRGGLLRNRSFVFPSLLFSPRHPSSLPVAPRPSPRGHSLDGVDTLKSLVAKSWVFPRSPAVPLLTRIA